MGADSPYEEHLEPSRKKIEDPTAEQIEKAMEEYIANLPEGAVVVEKEILLDEGTFRVTYGMPASRQKQIEQQ